MSMKEVMKKKIPYKIYGSVRSVYRYVASLQYVGDGFECLFCGGNFSAFLPEGLDLPVLKEKQVVGGGYRKNATCPRCYSGDRERLIYLFLKKKKENILSKSIELLHIAPESNLGKELKSRQNINYISADLNKPQADIKMDITCIEQRNDTYDVIICNHVLEHVGDDAKAMHELYRVLKKGGFAILQVPISYSLEKTYEDPLITSPEDRELNYGQKDHLRIYGNDYSMKLEKAGFTVKIYDFIKELDPSIVRKYGLIRDEKIFLCFK